MPISREKVDALTAAVREAAAERTWSRGVLLARGDAVAGQSETDEEIVLTVRVPERAVPYTIVLYVETEEWDCDCASNLDVCAHAAAAVIALSEARRAGAEAPTRKVRGATVRYDFSRKGPRILLERKLVKPDGEESILRGPLTAQSASAVAGVPLELSDADLEAEPLLSKGAVEVTHPEQVVLLLAALSSAREVRFEGEKIRTSAERILPKGRVEGDERHLVFTVSRDPAITEVLADGLARAGDVFRPLGELGIAGLRHEKLPIVRQFARAHFAELAGELLPMFRGRFEIEVATAHLPPTTGRGRPRIDLGIQYGEGSVVAAPELVYGNPPQLRIQDGRPIFLRGKVPERDLAAERRLVQQLRDELNLVTGRRIEVRGSDAGPFLKKLRRYQEENSTAEDTSLPRLLPRLEVKDDRFTLTFVTEQGLEDLGPRGDEENTSEPTRTAEAAQVLRAFEGGHDLVPLLGGGWGEIPRGWLELHRDRIALLLELSDGEGRVPLFGLPALAELADALDQPAPRALDRLAPLLGDFERIPPAELPKDLTAELRPYQKQGVDWLCFLREAGLGAVLADDMGLGKTLQALCAVRGKTLIVCPTSVLPNWAAEVARFRPTLRVSTFHGPGRALEEADVTLTTYTILRSDTDRLKSVVWDTVILDEAQAIKNAESQTARAAFALEAKFRVALTGTPIENRLEELWSQLHYTNRGLLFGRSEFTQRFARPISEGDGRAAARLRERIRPFVLRRMKREVARDLPPRTDVVLYAELDEAERGVYDAIRLATKKEVVERIAAGGNVLAVLEALLRLRQASCHRALVPGQSAETSAKVELLIETLAEAVSEGHKALVFSQWTSLLDLVEPHLRRAEIGYVRLDGTSRDRGDIVARFQEEGGPPVMIVSLKAGGTGLNLTAADHVFLLDPWWNPAVEDQAADRAHRIGQQRPVMVHRLVARGTVEERILDLQLHKRAIAEAALGEAAGAAALTKDDLLALFAD